MTQSQTQSETQPETCETSSREHESSLSQQTTHLNSASSSTSAPPFPSKRDATNLDNQTQQAQTKRNHSSGAMSARFPQRSTSENRTHQSASARGVSPPKTPTPGLNKTSSSRHYNDHSVQLESSPKRKVVMNSDHGNYSEEGHDIEHSVNGSRHKSINNGGASTSQINQGDTNHRDANHNQRERNGTDRNGIDNNRSGNDSRNHMSAANTDYTTNDEQNPHHDSHHDIHHSTRTTQSVHKPNDTKLHDSHKSSEYPDDAPDVSSIQHSPNQNLSHNDSSFNFSSQSFQNPSNHKIFHTVDLMGVQYKCVITTCNPNDPQQFFWTIDIFAPPNALGNATNLCYELIVRAHESKKITHGQMPSSALRELVKEALFSANSENDSIYFRYFFMKPPGVSIDQDSDTIADKVSRTKRLRTPSSPNDMLVLKIVKQSHVGDLVFWLPLKPVFGAYSKFTQDDLEQKLEMLEKRFEQYDSVNTSLQQQIEQLKADNERMHTKLQKESNEKVEILKRVSILTEEGRSSSSTVHNVKNLLRQQQHRLEEAQNQIQSTQSHSQRENQELKELIIKETEKSMRMKLSIASQNEHHAKMMNTIKRHQEKLESRVSHIESVGAEEMIEKLELGLNELKEKLKHSEMGGAAAKQFEELVENQEKLEREVDRLKGNRPNEAASNADVKKLKQQCEILRKNHLRALQENASIKLENMELKQMVKSLQGDNKDLQKDLEELLQRDGSMPQHSNEDQLGSNGALNDAPTNAAMDGPMSSQLDDPFGGGSSNQTGNPANTNSSSNQQPSNSSVGALTWNPSFIGDDLSLSNNNQTAKRSSQDSASWQSAIGQKTYLLSGVYQWNIKLTDACADADMFIGVADPAEIDVHTQDVSESGRAWTFYAAEGKVYHNGQEKDYGVALFTGNVLTTKLDLEEGTVGFSVDGTDYGVAFSEITGPVAPIVCFNSEDEYEVTFIE